MKVEQQKPLTLQQAAGIAGVSPDTVARWCKRYGIGRQLHPKAPWRVGAVILAAGDADALAVSAATWRGDSSIEPWISPVHGWKTSPPLERQERYGAWQIVGTAASQPRVEGLLVQRAEA